MIQEFIDLLDSAKEIHIKKNQDYSGGHESKYYNFEIASQFIAWGKTCKNFDNVDLVFLAIIGIKFGRIFSLMNQDKLPENETIEDTLKDLTVYTGMWAVKNEHYIRRAEREEQLEYNNIVETTHGTKYNPDHEHSVNVDDIPF